MDKQHTLEYVENDKEKDLDISVSDTDVDTSSASSNERERWSNKADFVLSLVGYSVAFGNVQRFPYLCVNNGGGFTVPTFPFQDPENALTSYCSGAFVASERKQQDTARKKFTMISAKVVLSNQILDSAFLIPFFFFLLTCGVPLYFLEVCLGQFSGKSPLFVWTLCPLFRGVGILMVLISGICSYYYNSLIAWSLYFLGNSFIAVLPWSSCTNEWNTLNCRDTTHAYVHSNSSLRTFNNETNNGTNLSVNFSQASVTFGKGNISASLEFWQYELLSFITLESFSALKYPKYVWLQASVQVFFSLGPCWGGVITMSSYSEFHSNCLRTSIFVALIEGLTSFLFGFIVFSILGFMAYEMNMTVAEAANNGPGIIFITYPEAISKLPFSNFWAVLFWIMMITVGLDTQFGMFETLTSGIVDAFPKTLRKRKTAVVGICASVMFLLGCTYTSAERFSRDVELMINRPIPIPIRICWCFVCPVVL
ncbi:hypothetical protein KUTeg_007069, partial [Tegillarca granosa]